jgi:hypothetical protein
MILITTVILTIIRGRNAAILTIALFPLNAARAYPGRRCRFRRRQR